MPHHWIPSTCPQAVLAVHAPHPYTLHTVVSSLCALLTAARVSSSRQLKSSTESQSKASPYRPGREQELELQLHSWESKWEAVSIQHVALQNQKAYKSTNSVTGKNKKCGAGTSIKALRGSQKPQKNRRKKKRYYRKTERMFWPTQYLFLEVSY